MKIRQLLIEARDCSGDLDDAEALQQLMRDAAQAVGATEHAASTARFVPHGVTAILILAESHILITTWSEHRLALVDVLLCNESMDPMDAWVVMRDGLQPSSEQVDAVERRVG